MLERHDWVTPTLSGTAWLEKPPLYYWQTITAYKMFGVSDWAARLPSVIDASAMAFALYWFLRRFRPGLALDGALMLVSSAVIIGFARAASTDMPLAAMFTIGMLCWWAWFEAGAVVSWRAFMSSLDLQPLLRDRLRHSWRLQSSPSLLPRNEAGAR